MAEIKIKQILYNSIKSYCKENDIIDIDKYCNDLIQREFNIERFGLIPGVVNHVEKDDIKKPVKRQTKPKKQSIVNNTIETDIIENNEPIKEIEIIQDNIVIEDINNNEMEDIPKPVKRRIRNLT